MKPLSLLIVLGLIIIGLAGCGEVKNQGKILSDDDKVIDDTAEKVKERMIKDIESKLLEGYDQVTAEEIKSQSSDELVTPKYLPERFQFHGIFMGDNPGIPTEKIVKQLWYDPEELEVLMVTQTRNHPPSPLEEQIIFTDGLETLGKINDIYPWAKYRCQYAFAKNEMYIQGYMLVNNERNRDVYERILKSLKENTAERDPLPKWAPTSRAYRTQGVISEIQIESDTLKSLLIKGTKKIHMPNNPVDYDYIGKTLNILFENASLRKSDCLKNQLKEGTEIIITFWDASLPDGETVTSSDLDYIYIVKDGRYYDWQGNEMTLSQIESNGR